MSETVEILRLGHAGDGVTADGRFVSYTVPGDVVRILPDGEHWRIEEFITYGPWRDTPPCRHFGRCGGCALQHVAREPYLDWKRDGVIGALKQRGFTDPPVEAIRAVPPGTRRRAMFKAHAAGNTIRLGFYESGSRNLVDLLECKLLTPELERLIAPLKKGLGVFMRGGETAELHLTATDSGIDLSLKWKRQRGPDMLMALAEFAADLKLARLFWNGELTAMTAPPSLRVGWFTVLLPAEAFLQPTKEGERILQTLVQSEIGDTKRIADLFSGVGTFALAMGGGRTVHAIDNAGAQIDALKQAAKQARGEITADTRDLYRRPLLAAELAKFQTVVLDPPRPGATAQVQQLAGSAVTRILYVSCSPASFARDARTLVDGGYTLMRVVPLDQFVWSAHVELFAVFART